MVTKPFDIEKHPPPKYDKDNSNIILDKGNGLRPRREILDEYEKVRYDYDKQIEDRLYERFYVLVKGRPVTIETPQVHRIKLPGKGEFIFYDAIFRGTDWKGNDCDFYTIIGKYEKPKFRLEKNPETQEVRATEITSKETIYDTPYTKEKLDEILEFASEPFYMNVHGIGGKPWSIQSVEDFREGSVEDLATSSRSGKSLATVLAEKNQLVYEKREQKKKIE